MLRLLVLLLAVANLAYFAWWQGWLAPYGLAPVRVEEPERLAQQIRPDALKILGPADNKALDAAPEPEPPATLSPTAPVAAAPRDGQCLRAGPYTEAQASALRTALASLPASAWSFESVTIPAHWIVYMGRYADNEAAEKKKGELRYLAIQFQPLTNPQLAPGLSLGGYDTQEAAQVALQALSQRGVRTARVVQERAPQPGQWLQLAAVDAGLRERITAARLPLAGKTLTACP